MALTIGVAMASSVQAANIFVGSLPSGESGTSVTSIQAAVNIVQPGDTIYLRAGNYHEAEHAQPPGYCLATHHNH